MSALLRRQVPALLGVVAVLAAGLALGQDRQTLMNRFDSLKTNALKAKQDGKLVGKVAVVRDGESGIKGPEQPQKIDLCGPGTIVAAAAAVSTGQPITMGVKIWGQVFDAAGQPGPYVNLTKYRWSPKQRFRLWVESAAPIQLAVFQNYPEGRPASRQISPDARFPDTFATLMPGGPQAFPIPFQMDDDLRKEMVSFIITRADVACLPISGAPPVQNVTQAAAYANVVINGNLPANSVVTVDAFAATTKPDGTLKGETMTGTREVFGALKAEMAKSPERFKLDLSSVPPTLQSATPADVETVLLGSGNVAQIELTFNK